MLSLRAHAVIIAGIFAAILAFAEAARVLHDRGVVADSPQMQSAMRVLFFGLAVLLFLAAIPLVVKLVLTVHLRLGHGERPHLRRMMAHERNIVLAFWMLTLAGLAAALPAAVRHGMFEPTADDAAAQVAAMPSQGTLVARPGLAVAEMVRRSSLPLSIGQTVIAGAAVFTFEIADTAIKLRGCRYYFINYAKGDASRVGMMSIGTASRSMSLAEVETADAELRRRLAADGWEMGREVYRTELGRRLHGGATEGPPAGLWLKGDTVLRILRRRMDDPKPGEAAGAGAWIQFVELGERDAWAGIKRFEFAPPDSSLPGQ